MPSASRMIFVARSLSSQLIACSRTLVMATPHVCSLDDSPGAPANALDLLRAFFGAHCCILMSLPLLPLKELLEQGVLVLCAHVHPIALSGEELLEVALHIGRG